MEYTNKKGQKYFLHGKVVVLRGGNRKQQIHWFARAIDKKTVVAQLPKGFKVVENTKTGLPVLKRVGEFHRAIKG
jgi:hypothetical protein